MGVDHGEVFHASQDSFNGGTNEIVGVVKVAKEGPRREAGLFRHVARGRVKATLSPEIFEGT
jgi:hypothetical protein